jgi:thiol:disulfide interchange protein
MPLAAEFQTTIQVASEAVAGQLPLSFSDASYGQVAELAETKASQTSAQPQLRQAIDPGTLALTILASLIGGLLLNLMPCVLPVIGLKVLAFAEQAGQKQAHVLMLNFWYSVGLISVFMVLATLAAFLNLGWGEQFTLTWFKVAMTALVFVMALSFLGVWEIPIPGFVGAGKSSKLQTQEGVAGAFFKGVFTTILATPCSGPFLGSAFGYTLSQPPIVTYVIFGSVGLGMASPYLLIGVFPSLIRFLPRPGAWMETFKQLLAFLLLATVVYLFSTLNATYFIPTLTLLVGLWFACWWIGRIPITAEANQKVRHWAGAAASAALVGIFAFKLLVPSDSDLPWKPYSPQTLAQLRAEGKTVLIDFTADWCPNCKWNLRTAINTQRVGKLVDQNNVVPLIADWTDRSPDIKEKLAELESNSIPLLAIYPAGQSDDEVIVLRDLLTESQVIEALKQAGPSQPAASATSTAMTRPAVERLPD